MTAERYTLHKLKKAIKNPQIFRNELKHYRRKLAHIPYGNRPGIIFKMQYGRGIDVVEQDWDNLIILDACRYDSFVETNKINGSLSRVISKGSNSSEFLEKNFFDRELHDTVYVTANPHAEEVEGDIFHKVIKTYGSSDTLIHSADSVFETALEAHDTFPNKRLIIHFMQPHSPYIGERAAEIRENLQQKMGIFCKIDRPKEYTGPTSGDIYSDLSRVAADGHISVEEFQRVYQENLEVVLEYVKRLIANINGQSVITADHGEYLGERPMSFYPRQFGHAGRIYVPALRFVPWLELKSEERRHIEPEPPVETDTVSEDVVEEQLRALGYK